MKTIKKHTYWKKYSIKKYTEINNNNYKIIQFNSG